jgi:tRNA (mo5U34)-methyltransferase
MAIDEADREKLERLPLDAWFTAVEFENWRSPQPPALAKLAGAHARKSALIDGWMRQMVPGSSVLDTFAANGAFSFRSAQLGATSVLSVEWDEGRVAAARAVCDVLARSYAWAKSVAFERGDVYDIARDINRTFDVTLCLGGLYHVADPPYVLRQLRALTSGHLIVQTSSIIRGRRNTARFQVRADGTAQGLTSIVGGSGKWYMTAACFRAMLDHAGFEQLDEYVAPPAYAALCKIVP